MKNITIALIFMLIGAMLRLDVAYSADATCLRVTAGMNNDRAEVLRKQ